MGATTRGPAAQRWLRGRHLSTSLDARPRARRAVRLGRRRAVPDAPVVEQVLANRQSSGASCAAYEDNGVPGRLLLYLGGWRAVVGEWRKPRYPTWFPVGPIAVACRWPPRAARRPSFSGGPVLLAQWVQDTRDRNVTCPAADRAGATAAPAYRAARHTAGPGAPGPAAAAMQRGPHPRLSYAHLDVSPRADPAGGTGVPGEPGVPAHRRGHRPLVRALGAGSSLPGSPNRMARFFTPY